MPTWIQMRAPYSKPITQQRHEQEDEAQGEPQKGSCGGHG